MKKRIRKKISRLIVWGNGISAQFRSPFIFQLLVGGLFFNKSIYGYSNKTRREKRLMDGVGGTLRDIFWQVKSGQADVYLHSRRLC